jgi:tripartite-type tricarboxylate transporter receptor subunit TctC
MNTLAGIGLASIVAVADLALAAPGPAQDYPTRPVRVITAGAGTFHDIVTRQMGQKLGERWGHPVVVEIRPPQR